MEHVDWYHLAYVAPSQTAPVMIRNKSRTLTLICHYCSEPKVRPSTIRIDNPRYRLGIRGEQ
jgi:hypothetical protein